MKKILLFAAAALALVACGKGSKDNVAPQFTWESNAKFAEMEIGKNMDAVITANVPGGVTVLTVTATIPTKLVGMAEQLIGISANKANESLLVFDFIKDGKCASSLRSFVSVSSGTSSFKMDFSKLLDALIGSAELPNGAKFTFKVHVEDGNENKKDCQALFKWTAGPTFEVKGSTPYELGSGNELAVNITAPGKIEKLTISFTGAEQALSYVKKRMGGSTSVDIASNADVATALGLPTNTANATSAKLDFAELLKDLSYEVSVPSTTTITVKVEDVLGKTAEQALSIVKK